jgi:hypothetical protein
VPSIAVWSPASKVDESPKVASLFLVHGPPCPLPMAAMLLVALVGRGLGCGGVFRAGQGAPGHVARCTAVPRSWRPDAVWDGSETTVCVCVGVGWGLAGQGLCACVDGCVLLCLLRVCVCVGDYYRSSTQGVLYLPAAPPLPAEAHTRSSPPSHTHTSSPPAARHIQSRHIGTRPHAHTPPHLAHAPGRRHHTTLRPTPLRRRLCS